MSGSMLPRTVPIDRATNEWHLSRFCLHQQQANRKQKQRRSDNGNSDCDKGGGKQNDADNDDNDNVDVYDVICKSISQLAPPHTKVF